MIDPPAGGATATATAIELSIGELLVRKGLITDEQRRWALGVQERTGSRLGVILVASGAVEPAELYAALAEIWGSEYVDPGDLTPDPELLGRVEMQQLLREGWVPIGRTDEGEVLVAVSERPGADLLDRIEAALVAPVRLVVSTERKISRAIQLGYRDAVVDAATLALWRQAADASARTVLDARQKVAGVLAVLVVAGCCAAFPKQALSTLSLVVATGFLLSIAFKFVVCMAGARRESQTAVTPEEVAAVSDDDLPLYTVLVPCYHEAGVVGQLVENLGRLDYPPEKLEILLLLEADDAETLAAARASDPPQTITFVIIPDSLPKTKPKACNVGLLLAKGEYLVIYDAEDRPDPDQLKQAVIAFRKSPPGTACVQAALNYFNADENVLTRLFTLEYSFWFDYMLPGLDALKLPIPLGGTSNHFVTEHLRELGGWDPFNVTEDADLGIRASARGLRVGVIGSTTFEEANRAYGNWVRQRSRWIKGYMQTFLVHARRPLRLASTAGRIQTTGFALLIGGTALAFLAVIPLYALLVVTMLVPPNVMDPYFPGWVLWVSLANLLVGNGLMIWVSMMGAFRRRRYWLVLWALLNPVYWIMHSVAAYKALWQIIVRPHYWEKTTHGLSVLSIPPAGGEPGADAARLAD